MPDHGTGIGVIDIEAGLPFAPEAAATREFAAHTLNFCLGFQLEEAAYSFSEADTVTYPADIQVAVNRGWFALENGAFLPEQPITAAEKDAMLADAAQVLAGDVIDESYESTYEFSEEVIELPENTVAQLSSDTELVLASPATPIAQGDIFVVYLDGFPVVYQADAVSVSGTVYTVTVTNLNINDYLTGVDAQGSASVDLADFIPEDDVEPIYVLEDGTEVSRAQLRATNKIKSIYFVKNIDGYSVNIQIYDMKLNWRSTGWTLSRLEVSAVVTGQMDVSISLPFGVDASDLDVDLTLGRIPIGGECFRRCSALADVELSASLREISNWYAFGDCVSLTSIFIPKSLEAAAQQTFGGCTNLKDVTFEDGMTRIPNYILHGCPGIEKIEIPASVSAIGRNAFEGAINLSDVTMPDSITKIEDTAFSGCTSLESVTLHGGMTELAENMFKNCDSRTTVTIPYGVTKVSNNCFYDCDALQTVDMANSVTKMGTNVFRHCDNLQNVKLSLKLAAVPNDSFRECAKLAEIVIPYYCTSIGSNAFNASPKLAKVVTHDKLASISTSAFSYADVTNFYGTPGSYTETWCIENGYTFNENTSTATSVTLSDKTVSIPKGKTYMLDMTIEPADFADTITFKSGNTDVATVDETGLITAITPADASNQVLKWTSSNEAAATVDANGVVTAIAKGTATITAICNVTVTNNAHVVTDVSALESSHNYPNGCSDFWLYTTAGADSLLVIFDARTEMEDGFDYLYLYDSAGSLVGTYTGTELAGQTVEIPGDTVKIQIDSDDSGTEWGFKVTDIKAQKQTTVIASGWSGATQWTLTDDGTLTIFGEGNMKNYAYGGGQPWLGKGVDITSVVIEEGVVSVGSGAFRNLTTLKSVTFPATTMTKMGEAAFYGSGLKSVEIPASLWTIQPYTFKNCADLTSVKFNEGNLQKISDGAFYGTGLTELVLPDCLDILDVYSFKGCADLTEISIGSGLTELREAVFYGTAIPAIETLTFGEELTSIGECAFYGCTGLTEIVIPDKVTSIKPYAFNTCTGLKTIVFPASLTSIGDYCFSGSYNLWKMTFEGDAPDIGTGAFKGLTATAYYPSGNASWTSANMLNYGGKITWKAQ